MSSLASIMIDLAHWMKLQGIKTDDVKIDIELTRAKDMEALDGTLQGELGQFVQFPHGVEFDPMKFHSRFKLVGFDMKFDVKACPTCGHKQ